MNAGTVKTALLVAALGAAGFVAWRAYKSGLGVAAGIRQAADQAVAEVQSAWNNNVATPWQRGTDYMNGIPPVVSSKAWLYGDYAYTGTDPATGQMVADGEWYGNEDARRYDYDQRANGTPPAATSNDGAAFGVYRRPWRAPEEVNDARQIDRILEREVAY